MRRDRPTRPLPRWRLEHRIAGNHLCDSPRPRPDGTSRCRTDRAGRYPRSSALPSSLGVAGLPSGDIVAPFVSSRHSPVDAHPGFRPGSAGPVGARVHVPRGGVACFGRRLAGMGRNGVGRPDHRRSAEDRSHPHGSERPPRETHRTAKHLGIPDRRLRCSLQHRTEGSRAPSRDRVRPNGKGLLATVERPARGVRRRLPS